MRRKKSRANRRVVKVTEEDEDDVVPAVEIEMKDTEPSKIVPEASKAGKRKKEIDREIVMSFKEEFEEVDNVVSAVMEMDAMIQQNKINNDVGPVIGNKLLSSDENISENINAGNVLEDSQKSNNLDIVKIEETSEEENVMGKSLNSIINPYSDSENEIENGEEAKLHANAAQQRSVEGEPSAASMEVMKLDGHVDDRYADKEDDGKERQQESRDDREQSKDIEVSEVNEVSLVINRYSVTEWKKEKQIELYVGGLHKDAVEQDLFEIFGKFGEVQIARIVRHPTTNRSLRFAFIQYATIEQARKVLSDLKDGIEVRGKRAKVSISHDRNVLYLGNICRTWTKEDVVEKLKTYGIEDLDEIQVPNDPKKEGRIKGFSLLRFSTCSSAEVALHRLRKPDAFFGNARGAKVTFAHTKMHSTEEVRLQVKTIYIEGIPKFWNAQKLKVICEQYGETKKVRIFRNFGNKGRDFGFISFTTRESAVACVKRMNEVQFGGGIKVKAGIAGPLVGGCLQKSTRARLKLNKLRRSTGQWKMKGHAKSERAKEKSDMTAASVICKKNTRETEDKTASVADKNNQGPSNSKHILEGKTNKQGSIPPEAHGAVKLEKSDNKIKNRKRQRGQLYSKGPSKRLKGSSQVQPSHSSQKSKSRSHLKKRPKRGADSVAYRVPDKEAYSAPISAYPGYAYSSISGQGRPSSYLEPHAGLVQPARHQEQYHLGGNTSTFQHQRQTCVGYVKVYAQYERHPPAKYFKPALGKDALPHAGFLEPAFERQSFDADNYPARRNGEHSSPLNQGREYRTGLTFSHSYVPNNISYARSEASGSASGYHRVSGAYSPTHPHY
ncbi:hypothetical protein COLO4_14173 [Corchorus olitorius]|uniref:RRM domain-containing protein n=1 Tax=Corchorus olitorius TaxID=93759 RepID=A0A1R3JT62_9ROSI|nr:hypothetical protein COLO4_14173 [Corchorus olitorius]